MLEIYFLNCGKGNCTIIDFPSGRLSMIDIDNSRISENETVLTDPIEYLQRNFKNRELFRFVLTHPDMDHMSGLYELSKNVYIRNFWDTDHHKVIKEEDWEGSPFNKEDWEQYLKFRKSSDVPTTVKPYRNETAECCWTQDGIKILSPSPYLVKLANETEDYNHLSYVLMVEYAGVKVLLSGDASTKVWEDIFNECGAESLKADIFLAPHHGSKHNIHEEAFKAIAPNFVIVSVAKGVDYDHQYYSQLARRSVLSTKYYGTMKVKIEDNGQYLPIIVEEMPNRN